MTSPIGITLPIQRGSNGMFQQSYTVPEQIKSNLINLLLTRMGERLHQPEFGCNVHQYIFNPMTDETTQLIQASIIEAIDRWMPFIAIRTVSVTPAQEDNKLQVVIKYQFRNNPRVFDTVALTF